MRCSNRCSLLNDQVFSVDGRIALSSVPELAEATTGEAHLRRALQLRMKAMPQGHWRIAEVQSALADCLIEQNRHAESEPLLLGSYASFEKKFGPSDPRTREIGSLVVRLYETWGKAELAAGYR